MTEHVVVIGGGILGVCTAYYLSESEPFKDRSLSVTIVEANEIASGASGKAAGFLALDWHGPATSSLAELSYALHQQLARDLDGENVYGYRTMTSLTARIRGSEPHEEPLADLALAESNPELHLLPPSIGVTQTRWLQSRNVESLDIVSRDNTTAQVHPELFTRTLFEKARARGVQYIKGRPSSWDEHSKFLKLETLDSPRHVSANTLVITAGPWTGRVVKQLLSIDVPMSYLPGHSILIRPSEHLPAHAVFAKVYAPDATRTPECFVRPEGLVYVSGENSGAELPDGTADVEIDPGAIQKLVKASAALSSFLADGTVEVKQLCYRPVTPHGTPYVGALKRGPTKAFVSAGHGPWGITLGPGTGKVMSEFVLDGVAHSADVSQLDPLLYI